MTKPIIFILMTMFFISSVYAEKHSGYKTTDDYVKEAMDRIFNKENTGLTKYQCLARSVNDRIYEIDETSEGGILMAKMSFNDRYSMVDFQPSDTTPAFSLKLNYSSSSELKDKGITIQEYSYNEEGVSAKLQIPLENNSKHKIVQNASGTYPMRMELNDLQIVYNCIDE